MPLRLCLLLTLLLTSSCAPSPPFDAALAEAVRRTDCGISAAMSRRPPPPESGATPVRSGDAVRACALPTAAEIENACESLEGVPIPGTQNPHDPDRPQYSFPDHEVRNAHCTFSDKSGSRAACRFDMAVAGAPPKPLRADLVYRFRDLSNSIMHGWYKTGWEVDEICRLLSPPVSPGVAAR